MKQYATSEVQLATAKFSDIDFRGFDAGKNYRGLCACGHIDGVPVIAYFSGSDEDGKDWAADFTGAEIDLGLVDQENITDDEIDALVERFAGVADA